jgi:hypothetical protein
MLLEGYWCHLWEGEMGSDWKRHDGDFWGMDMVLFVDLGGGL